MFMEKVEVLPNRNITRSKFGENLDTVADFVFAVVALCKLLPAIKLSISIWIWIGLIAVIKLINIVSGFVVQKRFVPVHSLANKMTGAVVFALPLTLSLIDVEYKKNLIIQRISFTIIMM